LNPRAHYIRIARIPSGEAPSWVREKWVGLELPLANHDQGPRDAYTSGVLSGPRNRLIAAWWGLLGRLQQKSGYAVDAQEALAILEKSAPDAAFWWRENVPRLRARKQTFLFDVSACDMVAMKSAANTEPTK
jgi:hypothetical protein